MKQQTATTTAATVTNVSPIPYLLHVHRVHACRHSHVGQEAAHANLGSSHLLSTSPAPPVPCNLCGFYSLFTFQPTLTTTLPLSAVRAGPQREIEKRETGTDKGRRRKTGPPKEPVMDGRRLIYPCTDVKGDRVVGLLPKSQK